MKKILLFLLLFLSALYGYSKPIKVLYIPPGSTGYWGQTTVPLPAVAEQLGIDLTISGAKILKESYIDAIERILATSEEKPDWIIWTQRRTDPTVILNIFKKYNIKSIDITSGFLEFDKKLIGKPQEIFPNWIAQVVNDDFGVGKFIAEELIRLRKKTVKTEAVNMIAIAGDRATNAAQQSVEGLKYAFELNQVDHLIQLVYAIWQKDTAKDMTYKLLRRHQRLDAIWSASTVIALGIIEQLSTMTFNHFPKPLVATIGWNEKTLELITQEKLAFSMGANNLTGVWALILIYDHEHGKAINTSIEEPLFAAPYVKATAENVKKIIPYSNPEHWKTVNIKQFSKVHNPTLTKYNFDFSIILDNE